MLRLVVGRQLLEVDVELLEVDAHRKRAFAIYRSVIRWLQQRKRKIHPDMDVVFTLVQLSWDGSAWLRGSRLRMERKALPACRLP